MPRITLEHWRSLLAVVDAGGYAQAASALHKSQSAVTYGVQKLEQSLGVKVFQTQGRKAHLTPAGQVLYRRARALIEEAHAIERTAAGLATGWEPEVRIAAESIFPTWLLLQCFAALAEERPDLRIDLLESVLAGTEEALLERRVDLAISGSVPAGFVGDPLMNVRFVAAAHPEHPLHRLGRTLTLRDLRGHRQLVIRDSGTQRLRSSGWLGAEQRWTVGHKATSIHAACMGLGFAWFPVENIRRELDAGQLAPLPLREGAERFVPLYLVFAERDAAGPGTLRLAEIVRRHVERDCADSLVAD